MLSVVGTAYETLLMTTTSAGASVDDIFAKGKGGGNKDSAKLKFG